MQERAATGGLDNGKTPEGTGSRIVVCPAACRIVFSLSKESVRQPYQASATRVFSTIGDLAIMVKDGKYGKISSFAIWVQRQHHCSPREPKVQHLPPDSDGIYPSSRSPASTHQSRLDSGRQSNCPGHHPGDRGGQHTFLCGLGVQCGQI